MNVRAEKGYKTLPAEAAFTVEGIRLDIPKRREAANENLGKFRPNFFDFGRK